MFCLLMNCVMVGWVLQYGTTPTVSRRKILNAFKAATGACLLSSDLENTKYFQGSGQKALAFGLLLQHLRRAHGTIRKRFLTWRPRMYMFPFRLCTACAAVRGDPGCNGLFVIAIRRLGRWRGTVENVVEPDNMQKCQQKVDWFGIRLSAFLYLLYFQCIKSVGSWSTTDQQI